MDYKKKTRNSSLELLRIICMFLIIFSHYFVHGNINYQNIPISFNEIFLNVMSMGGNFACIIFMLISGYFMIEASFRIEKILKLIAKVMIVGILISVIFIIFKPFNYKFVEIIKGILYLLYDAWFVRCYIVIYLISPYLNKMLKALDKSEYKKMIVLMTIIWSFISTIFINSGSIYSKFDGLLIIYIIGAFIKLHDLKLSKKNSLRVFLVIIISEIIIMLLCIIVGHYLSNSKIISGSRYILSLYSTFNLLSAIALFNYTRKIEFENKVINWIASGTLGIYLIHDHSLVRYYIWSVLVPNANYAYTKYLVIHFIIKCLLIFIICLIIDKLVDRIQKNTIDKAIDKLVKKCYRKQQL